MLAKTISDMVFYYYDTTVWLLCILTLKNILVLVWSFTTMTLQFGYYAF